MIESESRARQTDETLAVSGLKNAEAAMANAQAIEALSNAVSAQQAQSTDLQNRVYATPFPASTPTLRPTATPTPQQPFVAALPPIVSEGYTIQTVQRYIEGRVVDLNQLTVAWWKNPQCSQLDSKYGNTTGRLMTDNVERITKKYQNGGSTKSGFQYGGTDFHIPYKDTFQSSVIFDERRTFTRESREAPADLEAIGKDVYANACNDVAATSKVPNVGLHQPNLHQQLNTHMYGKNGVPKLQYALKKPAK